MVAQRGEGYQAGEGKGRDLSIAGIASVYGVWLIYAAGVKYLFLSMVLYAPGLLFYLWAKKEHGEKPFKGAEAALAAIIVVLGAIAAYELITGQLTL
jgi:arginine:ornithine antiporter/lysine permease